MLIKVGDGGGRGYESFDTLGLNFTQQADNVLTSMLDDGEYGPMTDGGVRPEEHCKAGKRTVESNKNARTK
jgi:hypothetical protein